MKSQKGFTLIELLVVIAILGVLATIALASLNSARTKSADASLKADMANMLAQAEIYYDGTGNSSFGASISSDNCATLATGVFSDAIIKTQITQAMASANTTGTIASCTTDANGQLYAIAIGPLRSNASQWWCVDNSGHKKALATAPAAGTNPKGGVCQ